MQWQDLREALSAVRHGTRWRIPHPEQIDRWERETTTRLKALGVSVPGRLRAKLVKAAKQSTPYWPEIRRLYLAAIAKALSLGRITTVAKERIDLLCLAAMAVLAAKDRRCDVETTRDEVIHHLKHNWHVRVEFAVGRYWPAERHFQEIRAASTQKQIELTRRTLDFTQAVREVHRKGSPPTATNLCPLLHADWLAHMNDTRERLPDVPALDLRSAQAGISVDQFRRRYSLRSNPWRSIIAEIYKMAVTPPSSADAVFTGKISVRSQDGR